MFGWLFRNASSHGPTARDAPYGPSPRGRSDTQSTGSTSGSARRHQTSFPQCSTGEPHAIAQTAHTRIGFSERLEVYVSLSFKVDSCWRVMILNLLYGFLWTQYWGMFLTYFPVLLIFSRPYSSFSVVSCSSFCLPHHHYFFFFFFSQ